MSEFAALIQLGEVHISVDKGCLAFQVSWETLCPIEMAKTVAKATTRRPMTTKSIFSKRVRLPHAELVKVGPAPPPTP